MTMRQLGNILPLNEMSTRKRKNSAKIVLWKIAINAVELFTVFVNTITRILLIENIGSLKIIRSEYLLFTQKIFYYPRSRTPTN